MQHSQIQEALQWRYATKKFDATKKISDKDWQTLTQSLTLAPSSYGLQPWKFLVIENPEVREKLKAVSWNQTQVTDASHLVVFLARNNVGPDYVQKYIDRIAEVRGIPTESLDGFKNMMIENVTKKSEDHTSSWTHHQTYIAMGFLLETAALLKVDAVPMEGLDPKEYSKILGLDNSGWNVTVAVALGYRHAEDVTQNFKKVRFADNTLIEYVK